MADYPARIGSSKYIFLSRLMVLVARNLADAFADHQFRSDFVVPLSDPGIGDSFGHILQTGAAEQIKVVVYGGQRRAKELQRLMRIGCDCFQEQIANL
jgi:hypothetical protein